MDTALLWQCIVIIICIAFSAFFSASETSFTSVNVIRLKNMAQNGNRRAERTLKLVDSYDSLLSTILIGNNIVNIVCASVATLLFTNLLGAKIGVPVSTAVITVAVLIFGEVSPKSLAKEHAESFALAVTPFLKSLTIILKPLNYLFAQWKKLLNKIFKKKSDHTVTPEELMTIVDEAQSGGGIDDESSELIRSAIEFDDLDVFDILTPRVDVIAVDKDDSIEEVARVFAENPHSRLPVYEGNIDRIIGMIHEKDFFCALQKGEKNINSMIKKVALVSPTMKISDLLKLLQKEKSHMAIVIDEFGGTEGIVTLEDILEELVGDIWDEHDVVIDYFKKTEENTYLIDCSAAVEDMFDYFEFDEETDYDFVTVGGWVMEHLGKIPEVGDEFTYNGVEVTVIKVDGRHSEEIKMVFPE